eukprot:jgi/Bigna1/131245/aug1.13_g5953
MKGRFSLSGSRPRSKLSSKRGSAKSKRSEESCIYVSPDNFTSLSNNPSLSLIEVPEILEVNTNLYAANPKEKHAGKTNKIIKLVAEDGAEFKISRRWACISSYIKKACEDDKVSTVTITKVDEESLERICEYMENRKGDDFIKVSKTLKVTMLDNVGKDFAWCAKWIDLRARHRPKFYKLIAAANHMGISGLVSLGVTKIATLLKYCRTEDIDRVLDPHITDGQLRQLRKFVVVNGKSKEKSYNSGT